MSGAHDHICMSKTYRLTASTAIHKGDREHQQDQVTLIAHARHKGCVLAVVADGMGGRSGGGQASDPVMMTARQLFERYSPDTDDPLDLLARIVQESHIVIRLTAISSEQEPPSTIAAFLITEPGDALLACSDGVWHYFTTAELAAVVDALSPREATQILIEKARLRARGDGDNLSLVIVKIEARQEEETTPASLPPLAAHEGPSPVRTG